MELIFKNKGETAGFSNWLKSFNEIQNSLLIEVDLNEKCFISKGFTPDHTVVKYGKISFDDAALELIGVKDEDKKEYTLGEWNENHDIRIKVGIFMILPKFIKVIDTFSGTDYKFIIEFGIFKNNNEDEFHAKSINFKSKTLTMKVKDCNISEFEQVSDDLFFNRINVIAKEMSYEISMDAIKNLISISSVFVTDPKRDIIKFYTKLDENVDKYALYAYDQTNTSYDYLLGYQKDGVEAENDVPIYRHCFLTAVNSKGSDSSIIITLPSNNKQKLRIETVDGTSYTVLSTVQQ